MFGGFEITKIGLTSIWVVECVRRCHNNIEITKTYINMFFVCHFGS
jgi:hypothetical protein